MAISIDGYEKLVRAAVTHYWSRLQAQSAQQRSKDADRGRRSAVTGGKQMDGFCGLFEWVLETNGLRGLEICRHSRLELPGYFRPTKKWDMLVLHREHFVAALEFKSQRGPSFGNNLNNRSEEALGLATDLRTAHRKGAYGRDCRRPWIGWLMLLEKCARSIRPVAVKEPHFPVFPEFRGASYAERYEIHLRRLVREGFFDGAALLLSTEEAGPVGDYREPASDLSIRRMMASLAGHTAAYLASE